MTTTTATLAGSDRVEGDVLLDEVADQQWRVLDARLGADDARALLGFVALVDGRLEVMRMSCPTRTFYCSDLPAVRILFSRGRVRWLQHHWIDKINSLLAA